MALAKIPRLVDIQKMKASTNEKKVQLRHLRFLAQRLVNTQPLLLGHGCISHVELAGEAAISHSSLVKPK
jgi:hypothetical protein